MTKPRKVLLAALRASGKVLRRLFGKVSIRYKGHADILTEADTSSQKAALGIIRKELPDHDFMAEEKESRSTGSDYLWIIDPLDGTTNFAHGYPAACVSIGLLKNGKPVLGGIYDPFRDEMFTAERKKGTYMNGKRLRVSRTASLSTALLITGFPYDRHQRSHFYTEYYRNFMTLCHDIRRSGTAALDLAWIAAGRADGFWEFNLSPWDVAAGWLLIEEAGGRVGDFSGHAWSYPGNIAKQTLASNGRIHDDMLKTLQSIAQENPWPQP